MSRYIDADALLKEWKIEFPKKRPVKGDHSKEFLEFMKKYENHPYFFAVLSLYLTEPADVREVVYGKWHKSDFVPGLLSCNQCGAQRNPNFKIGLGAWNYCPNCGADMRERVVK